MKVRKLLAMLLVLTMVLSITLPTAVLAVEGDDAGTAVTQTTESTQPDEGGDTATVPDEGDDTATVPDEGDDTATVPDEGDDTATVPDEGTDPTPAPSESADPAPAPSESADPTPEPSESADPTPAPSESADPTPVPSESTDPTPVPSESADPTPVPSESTDPTPTPSESTVPAPTPSESTVPAPTETVEIPETTVPGAALCKHGNDPTTCPECAAAQQAHEKALAVAKTVYDKIMAAKTLEEYAAAKVVDPMYKDSIDALLAEYVATLTEDQQADYAAKIAELEALLPPILSFETVEEIYAAIMSAETVEELELILSSITEEQAVALEEMLTEEDIRALAERMGISLEEETVTPPKAYTEVGPLMPPVYVGAMLRMARSYALNSVDGKEGLVLSKDAQRDADGNYDITLTAYTTGSVTSSENAVPADVVLILDESGSMDESIQQFTPVYELNQNKEYYVKRGDSYTRVSWCKGYLWIPIDPHDPGWYTGGHFIIHWGSRYEPMTSAEDTDPSHVQFYEASNASQSKREALINAAQAFVDDIYADATQNNVEHRVSVITFANSSTKEIGLEADIRNNVDNVKTAIGRLGADGGTYIEEGTEDATEVFRDAAQPSQSGNRNRIVVIFTDGIPGSGTWNNSTINSSANPAIEDSYTLKNTYGATVYTIGMLTDADPELEISDENDDSARTNKFLHYLSSNYPQAQSMSNGGAGSNQGYYLSASDTASLDAIFEKIYDQIATPSIELGAEAVVEDTISTYFERVPGSEISVYTADYDGQEFGEWDQYNDAEVDESGDTIRVTNFDFNANFVSDNPRNNFYGRMLIIQFKVQAKDEFWGGNEVPTNEPNSGVYQDESAATALEYFEVPTVDVQIHQPEDTSKTTNIYYGGDAPTADDVYTPIEEAEEPWQTEYVHVSYGDLEEVSNTEDGTYTVTVTVDPKYDGTEEGTTATCTGTVNVYTPVIAFADRYAYVTQAETSYSGNLPQDDVTWEHDNAAASEQTEFYKDVAEPQLTYTAAMVGTDSASDFHVRVSEVKNGNTVIPAGSYRTTHKSCDLGNGCTFHADNGDFMVHIFRPTITWKDSKQNYNTELTQELLERSHKVSVVWKHSSEVENTVFVTKGLLPSAPTLTYGFQTTSGAELVDTHLTAETDVQVTLDINGTPATNYTRFVWDPAGPCDCASGPAGAQFRIHLNNFDLVVKKTVSNPYDSHDTFLFTLYQDGKEYATFTLTNGGEATFKNLEAGHSYSVEEDTGWSWRYTPQGGASKTVDTTTLVNNTATVAFTNTRTNNNWLSQDASAENDFGSTGVAVTRSVAALPPERAKLAVPDEKGEEAE